MRRGFRGFAVAAAKSNGRDSSQGRVTATRDFIGTAVRGSAVCQRRQNFPLRPIESEKTRPQLLAAGFILPAAEPLAIKRITS